MPFIVAVIASTNVVGIVTEILNVHKILLKFIIIPGSDGKGQASILGRSGKP